MLVRVREIIGEGSIAGPCRGYRKAWKVTARYRRTDRPLSAVYPTLAEAEDRHAAVWEGRLRGAGSPART